METNLDRDFWPLWVVESAGLLFPVLTLVASLIAVAVHGHQTYKSWLLPAWPAVVVAAFLLRYRLRRVASMAWEFHFGMWLVGAPMGMAIAGRSNDKFRWLGVAVFAFGFAFNAANYVKRFYLSKKVQS